MNFLIMRNFFQYKWVDEIKRGAYCNRFTCADVKRKYSREELEEETNTFAPTLYEGSHVFLELFAARSEHMGQVTSGARTCWVGIPEIQGGTKEYQQHFQEWLRSQRPDVQRKFEGVDLFKDVVLEVVENMSRIDTVDAQPVATTGKSSSR